MNPGSRSAVRAARSGRSPLDRPLNSGGISDTLSSHTAAPEPDEAETTKRLVDDVGAAEEARSDTVYWRQSVVRPVIVPLACMAPSVPSTSTVSGPVKPGVALANNRAVYVWRGRTGIPKKPPLAAPTREPAAAVVIESFNDRLSAALSGFAGSSATDPTPAPVVTSDHEVGAVAEAIIDRFWISSPYR